MGLGWILTGIIMAISIIGIPWAKASWVIAGFSFWPFGRTVVDRHNLTKRIDLGTGPWGLLGNIIWLLLFGWWLALGHLVSALLCTVTIIGIPFAIQHLKLAGISLAPIGKEVVSKATARAL
jgi:uncharacterized membrane protein YccF (DUF307 family)